MQKKNETICLGIESTAHTLGVGIASSRGIILADANAKYIPPLGRGIHPREAAQHHSNFSSIVLKQAIENSGIDVDQIDAVAFSVGPGLGPVLRTGATMARCLALLLHKPLVPVHHAVGHIEIASLVTRADDPLVVLVSGGHTTITAYAAGYWRICGETEDITLGNLLDVFSRKAHLPKAGGLAVEEYARGGSLFLSLPYVVKGNDVSYSGLLSASLRKLDEGVKLEDLCFSLQEVAFSMLVEATERALVHTGKKGVLLAGGVAANKRLQEMLRIMIESHDATFYLVPEKYSGDCGAQIAWAGLLSFQSGVEVKVEESFVKPKWRLSEVKIPWRNGGSTK
jgi:N6-L-threonylcarbamoyladenine synthase